jgi:GNAT superfamily N-acetyltransferase
MAEGELSGLARRVEKLCPSHAIEDFDCGREELNRYFVRYAWANQQAGAGLTYVVLVGATVAGYYTLAVGQVMREEAPERLSKGLARHPVPIMLLARLAVDRRWQGQGVGKALLKDAMLRTLQAAEIAGIRGLAVHAKDEEARAFYERFDFVASPTDPRHLFVLLKDVRAGMKTNKG